MLGISSRQGVHHVAQKLSSTTLPRSSDRRCVLPCTSSSSSAGVAPAFHAFSGCAAAGKASATRNTNASLIELLYRKKKARRSRRALVSRGLLGVFLGFARSAAGLRAGGLLARLRLGGLGLLRVFLRFGLGFGLGLGLGSLRVGAQREGGREQCNQQFVEHEFSSVGKGDPFGSEPNNARLDSALTAALGPHRDLDSLHAVVSESRSVPGRLERLALAGGIGGAARELVLAGTRVPCDAPRLPCVLELSPLDYSIAPDTVHGQLDAIDVTGAAPCSTTNGNAAGGDNPFTRIEVRNARRDHEGIHAHARARRALLSRRATEVIARRLLQAVELLVDRLDGVEPFHARHAVPARHDEAQRSAVLRRQRLAVHGIGEQHFLAPSELGFEAARKFVLHAAIESAVGPAENDVFRLALQACAGKQQRERHAGPLRGGNALLEPRDRRIARRELPAPVAGAFQRHSRGLGWKCLQTVEIDVEGMVDKTRNVKLPAGGLGRNI